MTTSYQRRAEADKQEDVRRASAELSAEQGTAHQSAAFGGTMLAAVLMVLAGLLDLANGIEGVVKSGFYVATPHYLYNINTTNWGWIHVGIGALLVLVGLCLFARMTWARVVGIGLVVISAVLNFLFIPRYPFWAILLVALDIFIIWALASVKRPAR
jgi:hypothetical protein